LFEEAGGRKFRSEAGALVARVDIGSEQVMLAKPQTFMNLSGDSVRPLLERYAAGNAADLIVASDDVALPFGMIRVRARGSAGGQKGLKSIIDRLGTQEFPRIRLGAAPDHPVADLASFVLSRIPKRDAEVLDQMLSRASEAIETMIKDGVERAMSRFNERVKTTEADSDSNS
jgi:PTH1 family peptidyl-tRNA hydrolase